MTLAFHILGSLMFVYVLIAAGEYSYHRVGAHTMPPRKLRWIPHWRQRCKKHLLHHFKYYLNFHHEPDEVGRVHDLKISLVTSCVMVFIATVPIYFIDPITAVVGFVLSITHSVLFNLVHSEIHLAETDSARRIGLFRYWERHHFLHHLYPYSNFDGVFPLFDWLLGTLAKPTEADMRLMCETLGYDCPLKTHRRLSPTAA